MSLTSALNPLVFRVENDSNDGPFQRGLTGRMDNELRERFMNGPFDIISSPYENKHNGMFEPFFQIYHFGFSDIQQLEDSGFIPLLPELVQYGFGLSVYSVPPSELVASDDQAMFNISLSRLLTRILAPDEATIRQSLEHMLSLSL